MDKSILLSKCKLLLEQKITLIDSELSELDKSQNSETKSSMGDKYETSREMMQRERDQLSTNLLNNKQLLTTLLSIDIHKKNNEARLGSLVFTSQNIYFLAVGIGEINIENQKIWVISTSSPIGKLLLGKKVKDFFRFNNADVQILDVQ